MNTFTYKKYLTLLTFLLVLLQACDNKVSEPGEPSINTNKETDSVEVVQEKVVPPLVIRYRLDSIVNSAAVDSLFDNFTNEQAKIILALNRLEQVRVGPGTVLVIPDTLFNDIGRYSPFPQTFQILEAIPKTVLIAQRIQAFALYENGRLVRWGPVSSGKQSTPTPNGLHYGNFKAKRKVSTVNKDWILPYYFNFMNFEGVGVHQYLLPGFPASHACVRLYMEDAEYIYNWANQWRLDAAGNKVVKNGTPFMVFGEYKFDEPYPWLDLIEDPDSNILNKEEMNILEAYVKSYMQDERNFVDPTIEKEGGIVI